MQDEVNRLPEPADGEEMSVDANGNLCWTESDLLRDGHGLHPMAGESPNDYTAVGKDAMVLGIENPASFCHSPEQQGMEHQKMGSSS